MFRGSLCLRFPELLEWRVMRFALSRTVSVQFRAKLHKDTRRKIATWYTSALRDHSSSEETENELQIGSSNCTEHRALGSLVLSMPIGQNPREWHVRNVPGFAVYFKGSEALRVPPQNQGRNSKTWRMRASIPPPLTC